MGKAVNNWVIAESVTQDCLDRLGDARRLSDSMSGAVGVLLMRPFISKDAAAATTTNLIRFGADFVIVGLPKSDSNDSEVDCENESLTGVVPVGGTTSKTVAPMAIEMLASARQYGRISSIDKVDATILLLTEFPVTTVFAGGDPASREWASLLAAKMGWSLFSPAMMVEYRGGQRVVTRLNHSGRKSCQVTIEGAQPIVATLRSGVAEACLPDDGRTGEVRTVLLDIDTDRTQSRIIPADPEKCDIRDTRRLVSGGRGLGAAAGFQVLRNVAKRLGAGVSASRMAVDLGWIEYERQVGQTGKTVAPDVYIACGISGASHHLEGMSESQHIIAINTDVEAPILKKADLSLVADLHLVLREVELQLDSRATGGEGGAVR